MDIGAHTAHSLGEESGILGVPAFEDHLDPAEKRARAPCVAHLAMGHLHFDTQVTLYPCNGIHNDPLRCGDYRFILLGFLSIVVSLFKAHQPRSNRNRLELRGHLLIFVRPAFGNFQ